MLGVFLSAVAQILLKYGMSRAEVQRALSATEWSLIARAVCTNGNVLVGLLLYVGSMIVWLFVLAKVDVSQAYPFVGVGFIITMVFGWLLLGESVNMYRITGTILVAFGVFLVSWR
jgi:multidrug transporter EmrE-like cation transporter